MTMKRIFVLVGIWASVLAVVGECSAVDPKRPGNQPNVVQPLPSGAANSGLRYVNPPYPNTRILDANRRAAQQAAAAAAAARNSAAARNAAVRKNTVIVPQNVSVPQSYYRTLPYGYGYGNYGPYGYPSYGYYNSPYGYVPAVTTPYAVGYDPLTGQAFLYPNVGYPQYGSSYSYYRNPYLGYGYPAAVFVPAGLLYGLGPIQQLMGLN